MRWKQLFLPTLREDPKDSDALSYKLMIRAGLIRRLGSGAYSYLPLAVRSLHKAIQIVREEMNRAGAQELLLPAMQPAELWKETGRYDVMGEVLIKFRDRTGKEIALGPTHEEVVTDLIKEIQSRRQLPVTVYQIQTKFRDEPRPRFGIIRSKEFLMKDAYSFDADHEGLNRSYQLMYDAYQRIFKRCGLQAMACEADTGAMGGDISHEFMAPADSGEDKVIHCTKCGYAANREVAVCPSDDSSRQAQQEPLKPIEVVKTPGKHTIKQVSELLNVPATKLIKTLIYEFTARPAPIGTGEPAKSAGETQEPVKPSHVAVLIRGDHELNEAKLARVTGAGAIKLAGAAVIERLSGAPVGFTGPVKLEGAQLLADHAVMSIVNGVTGANQADAHLINVNPVRDFRPEQVADLRFILGSDPCPKCRGKLEEITAVEIGHVFKLGTKYSQALGAMVQDAQGKLQPMIMGCYGIGVNRILACAIEQSHDGQGIIWPRGLAPFEILISLLDPGEPELAAAAEALYARLVSEGREVLLDDREQSPGAKLKDADLIGIPVQVVVGKVWQREKRFELCLRATKERLQSDEKSVSEAVSKLLDKAP